MALQEMDTDMLATDMLATDMLATDMLATDMLATDTESTGNKVPPKRLISSVTCKSIGATIRHSRDDSTFACACGSTHLGLAFALQKVASDLHLLGECHKLRRIIQIPALVCPAELPRTR